MPSLDNILTIDMEEVIPHDFTSLGGKERPIDTRDFNLGSVQIAYQHPSVYMSPTAWDLPVLYQGKRPACGAHAGTTLKMNLDAEQGLDHYHSPRAPWIYIKKDGTSPSAGTDMRSIFKKALQDKKPIPFSVFGNDVDTSDTEYADASELTATIESNAINSPIQSYAFLNGITFEGLKNTIYQNGGVLLLIEVGEQFWTAKNGITSWQEKDILPLRAPVPIVDGHFIFAHSFDEQYIYFLNSFGPTWGRKGHGYFDISYLPYILEAGTAIDMPLPTIPKQPEPTIAELTQTRNTLISQALGLISQLLQNLFTKLNTK